VDEPADDDPFDFSDLESELAGLRGPLEQKTPKPAADDAADLSVEHAPHDDEGEPLIDAEALALLAEHEAEQAARGIEPAGDALDSETTQGDPAAHLRTQIGVRDRDTPWRGDTSPPQSGPATLAIDAVAADVPAGGRRYALGRELGRGGMGQVLEARDLALERSVALKLLIDQDDVSLRVRFMDEARVTGQLQHPGVPPVYELGKLGDGRLFFAMRRIEGRTLRDVLEDLKYGDAEVEKQFGRVRLLTVMSQVCRTIAYAHSRGVIHRDLKPDNIMLGEFGEVTVMDWGLAKPVGKAGQGRPEISTARQNDGGRFSTQNGEVTGTPQYMPPEQAVGRVDDLGPHSDNYSLGAMLYEILTLEPPFDGPSARAIRDAVVNARVVPPSERTPDRPVPHAIEQLCLQCLAKEPRARPKSALAIAEQIDRYLEGEQDRARKEGERRKLHELGKVAAEQWYEGYARLKQLQARTSQMRARIEPWAGTEERDPLWKQEDEEQKARLEAARHLSEALAHYHGALGVAGDNATTRQALAELYYSAFEAADRDRDTVQVAHYENLVRAFDDEGQFRLRLKGDGRLEIETLPRGLQGTLYQMRVVDRVLTPASPQSLGQMPVRLDPLPIGSYLVKLHAPGLSEAVVPIYISRQESVRLRLRVFPDAAVGKGFVHVAGGPARVGGDPQAQLATPPRTLEVPDFFIARRPVTCAEYQDFLRGIAQLEGVRAALLRAPRTAHGGALLWPTGPDGLPQMPERDATGQGWHPDWPIVCVSCEDAEAYCAWRHQVTGQRHRLPTEVEWEKAARGADGRLFPWGDAFEATFCHMGISRPGAPARGPSGQFTTDRSPYGVEDLAGSVSEWTSSWLDEGARQRIIKGGHWASSPTECRAASRFTQAVTAVLPTLGFRVTRDAPA
jgi:serine/threonine-protein kinase